jgi:hypothetical protein
MAVRAFEANPKRAVVSAPDVQPDVSGHTGVNDQGDVPALAHMYWQQRGCPIGSDQEDWFRAEKELKSRMGSDPKAG